MTTVQNCLKKLLHNDHYHRKEKFHWSFLQILTPGILRFRYRRYSIDNTSPLEINFPRIRVVSKYEVTKRV